MTARERDRAILRRLADRVAEIASLPIQRQTIEGWSRLNSLQPGKPMVLVYQMPWHEMDTDGELALRCEDGFNREVERELRETIYQWTHVRADMVVEPWYPCNLVVHDSGFGINTHADTARTDDASPIVARRYHPQIHGEADLAMIRLPEVRYDADATDLKTQRLSDVFGDILPIHKQGANPLLYYCYAPWDDLVQWWGVREALLDLVDRPELVHLALERLTQAYLHRLDQLERLNLLAQNNGMNIWTGGYGYTDELPPADFDPDRVRAKDVWGSSASQIFAAVSPRMHEEFSVRYERRFLERFGLNYYGCCEPLDRKVEILRGIPRLRKISMSPWVDVERGITAVGQDYVFSYKPNPAILAADGWDPQRVRRELRQVLERAKGCYVEIILKDISTVGHRPERLWQWAEIASEVTAEFA